MLVVPHLVVRMLARDALPARDFRLIAMPQVLLTAAIRCFGDSEQSRFSHYFGLCKTLDKISKQAIDTAEFSVTTAEATVQQKSTQG